MMDDTQFLSEEVRNLFKEPFPIDDISWKPQQTSQSKDRAYCVPYASLRVYEERLDEYVPGWQSEAEFIGFESRVACTVHLTINGVTRAGDGDSLENDKNAATTAYAQAFKRACSRFGLGRYLYYIDPDKELLWVDYDDKKRKPTPNALQVLKRIYANFVNVRPEPEKQEKPHMIDERGLSTLRNLINNDQHYSMEVPQQWTNLLQSLSIPVTPPEGLTNRRAGVVFWYIKEQDGITVKKELTAQKAKGKAIAMLAEQREITWQEAKEFYVASLKSTAAELGGEAKDA